MHVTVINGRMRSWIWKKTGDIGGLEGGKGREKWYNHIIISKNKGKD